jgi:inner membrane protein
VATALPLRPRERLACVAAAALADLDGISLLGGWDVYARWHHVLGHNIFFGVLLASACAVIGTVPGRRAGLFGLSLALFHLHLLMDYWGSGPSWGIAYLWPVNETYWVNPESWQFGGWQDRFAAVVMLIWMVIYAWRRGPWPIELVQPHWQVAWDRYRAKVGKDDA